MAEVFQRLVGLETEYALRHPAISDPGKPQVRFRLYEAVVTTLQSRCPTVPARHFKEGIFTANGGAVWFEAERPAAGGGLIEGATPECRGPREVVAYQRAQDRLLSECAAAHGVQLLKNDRDAFQNVYGAQENYEAVLATGGRLALWRLGLIGLFPLALLTWIGMGLCVLVTIIYFAAAGLVYFLIRLARGDNERLGRFLFGNDLMDGREHCVHVAVWLETTLQFVTRVLTAPLAGALLVLLRVTAFKRTRRCLTPFLASRCLVTGAGMLDPSGRFQLADKAPAINCVVGLGGMLHDRPLFTMGHFFKAMYAESWFLPREYAELFGARQRLQIALGDSNMCETAEYLRVGTTLLVLDAIEAGLFQHPPRLRRPIKALHDFCADPTLKTEARLRDGQSVTALQLQRYYLAGCRAFLSQQPQAPKEAWSVLQLWEQTLEQLEFAAAHHHFPQTLVGVLDWVTKQFLLESAGADAAWLERKKIDLRYHELSAAGYFQKLADCDRTSRVVADEAIERAGRTAPADSPATTRAHYIREFAGSDIWVTANWKSVQLGRGWGRKTIRLSRYGRAMRQSPRPPRTLPRKRTAPDSESQP